MSSSAPIRRGGVKIKAPRTSVQSSTENWSKLAKAISEIQNKRAGRLSFEEHYRYAYNLCLHKQGNVLYQGLTKLIEDHLKEETSDKIGPVFPASGTLSGASTQAARDANNTSAEASAQQGETFLTAVKQVWDDHLVCMSKLKDVLKYMDKVYVTSNVPPLLPTYTLGLSLFLTTVIRNSQQPVEKTLIAVLLSQIRLDRQNQTINKSAIRSCVSMLTVLRDKGGDEGPSVYSTLFEKAFLSDTQLFYSSEADELLLHGTAVEYLIKVERRLYEEDERLHHYLNLTTQTPLVDLLDHTFISEHLTHVISHASGGLATLLEQNQIPDLSRMYRLFGRVVEGHLVLKKAVKDWVVLSGLKIADTLATKSVAEDEKGKVKEGVASLGVASALMWVQGVLDLKDKMDKVVKEAWENDLIFQTVCNEAFESFINQNQKVAEFVSLFLDDHLKKGLKGKSDDEINLVIEKAITIFRFISDKDFFETFYRRHLALRLLSKRSVSDDAERAVLAKLKVESGAGFVRDLQGMLTDIKLSDDTMRDYKTHIDTLRTEVPHDISAQICTSSYWPMTDSSSLTSAQNAIFPESFVKSVKIFESFYLTRHTGRKLAWRADMGSVDVRVQFKARKHELNMTTHCMIVLYLFETLQPTEALSFPEIATGTAIPIGELKRVLQSLACGKFRILTKDPKSRDVNETDKFYFNDAFTSPLAKIKIQQIANRVETSEEGKETRLKVEEDRKYLAQACIVRVMKDRRTMQHGDLVHEVTRQLAARFQPKPIMIKQQIEIMLEREYLERDADNRKILKYQA